MPETHVYVQITDKCNQHCVFCNRPPKMGVTKDIPIEKIIKRIDEIKGKATRLIFTGGEPTFRRELPKLIRYAKKAGIPVVEMQTNGTRLGDMNYVKLLKDSGLDRVYIAFHSHIKEKSNILRGVKFGFEDIIKGINNSLKSGIHTSIIHVINSLNYPDLPDFARFVVKNFPNIENVNLSIVVPEGWAWENKWIIPRLGKVKPYLIEAMKILKENNIKFDVSEVVPLCIVEGFEEYAASTKFLLKNLTIVDDYFSGKRILPFRHLDKEHAVKAPQCKNCTLNPICAGVHPRYIELYGYDDYIPSKKPLEEVMKKFKINNVSWELEDIPKKDMRGKTLYLFLTERCNENCVFCVVKGDNKGKFGELSFEDAKKKIDKFVEMGGESIQFTGGEPTLHEHLPDLIKFSIERGIKNITTITNGVRFSEEKFLKKIIDSVGDVNKIWFSVSLHSHIKEISEEITRSKNTFEKTLKGIENILKYTDRIGIYHVITSLNYKHLEDFIEFIHQKYPKIKYVILSYVFPQGEALKNPWIFPRLSNLKPHLINAIKLIEKYGIKFTISACGTFPLCFVPNYETTIINQLKKDEKQTLGTVGKKSFHEFEMTREDWKKQYKNKNNRCRFCVLNPVCQGLWKEYMEIYGNDELTPIFFDEWKNKVIVDFSKEMDMEFIKKKIESLNKNKLYLISLRFDEKSLNKETGKKVMEILSLLEKNKIEYLISRPLPVCIFEDTASVPQSFCLELIKKKVGDYVITFDGEKIKYDELENITPTELIKKRKVIDKCRKCPYFLSGKCLGITI